MKDTDAETRVFAHIHACEGKKQPMSEKQIERKLVEEVRKMGGIAPKLVSPGLDGMPDRLVLMPDGKMAFVELKRPGGKPRPIQRLRSRQLVAMGYGVYVVDGIEQIGEVLDGICTT